MPVANASNARPPVANARSARPVGIAHRIQRLLGAKEGLDRTIADEQRRPLPDVLRLSALKGAKLRINDQLMRLRAFAADAAGAHAEARVVARQKRRGGMVRA